MSRDSSGPRKTFSKGGSSDFNKRKSFSSSDKPKRPYSSEGSSFKKRDGDSTEKRSYTKREDSSERPRKSFGDSEGKSFSGEKRTFGKRQDGSFKSKSSSSFGGDEKRSYTKREGSSEERPRRSFDSSERKPFTKREDGKYESSGPRKSYGDEEKRSYEKREGSSEERPRRSFDSNERKPYAKREGADTDRPRRSFDANERKPYAKRENGDAERPRKTFGEKRDFDKPYETKLSKSDRVIEKSKKAGPSKTSTQKNVTDDAVRLNRYVANAGICSRREADVLIATGVVTVNGKIVVEMGYKVNPTDVVNYGGVPIKNEVKKYLILNKPKDYITTMDDPEERKTVMELIRKACKERLYPVGRLDRNTTGVLLFTNDGDLTAKLTHPKFGVRKIYHVVLDKRITSEDFKAVAEGFELSDGFIKPDAVEYVGEGKYELGVEIHSGRNRIVRRIFEHLGYEVMKLDRVAFAGLTKKDLPRSKFRFLTPKEVDFLKMLG
jgi:23S rRNA pseudouridine2605 synthase